MYAGIRRGGNNGKVSKETYNLPVFKATPCLVHSFRRSQLVKKQNNQRWIPVMRKVYSFGAKGKAKRKITLLRAWFLKKKIT